MPEFELLFVCTGNLVRSPIAEALARRELAAYPTAPLRVSSAGSHATEGDPAAGWALRAAAARGANLERHYARELTRRRVRAADLILCMAGEHLDAVFDLDRTADERTFLLVSFARGAPRWARLAGSPQELVALAASNAVEQPSDDVDDPLGQPPGHYLACARRLDRAVSRVIAALLATLGVVASRPDPS
jgi:protein-tyrosine-phosphatase